MVEVRMTGSVTSWDGTPIAYERSGSGPPLVLVHGTTASRTRWAPVLPTLEARHTVYAMDRRGRGDSGDTQPYSLEREFEDVAAVLDAVAAATSTRVDLVGHSFGGLCAMEAALRTTRIRRLIVYEGAPAGVLTIPSELVERMQAQVDAGDGDGAVQTMMREVVRMPEEQLALLRSLPAWQARVAAAHTIPRELRATNTYRMEPGRMAQIRVPTLLLVGGDSPSFFRTTADAAQHALPDARLVVLPGQQHAAMDTAPDLFSREVLAFLDPFLDRR
jgi:pimeloyl-ACP methyl ester carboxylesterase